MKTQKNSRNISILQLLIGALLIYSSVNGSIKGQTDSTVLFIENTPSEIISIDPLIKTAPVYIIPEKNPDKKSNKKVTLKKVVQFVFSLLQQNAISKKSKKNGPYDVIIVPGFPYHDDKKKSIILKVRIKWACNLISKGIAKNVIFSGSSVYTPYVESQVMALYAKELGVSEAHIFCESNAEHSTENLVYSLNLATKLGFKKIAVATGPFQSAFLSVYSKNNNLNVCFIPINVIRIPKAEKGKFPEINVAPAFVKDFVSIKERESRSERFQGTLGNNIMEKKDVDFLVFR